MNSRWKIRNTNQRCSFQKLQPNFPLQLAMRYSSEVPVDILYTSAAAAACSFNQPVPFFPIIMQIECHNGAMCCQHRSRLTECKNHGLRLLFLVLLMLLLLLLIHLILISFSVFCPCLSRTFILIFPYILFLLCLCISLFPKFCYLLLFFPFRILCYSSIFLFLFLLFSFFLLL